MTTATRANFNGWDEKIDPTEVRVWVDRAVDYIESSDRDLLTYLNIRNLIFNALGGPHIDAYQVRYAVGRHPRLVALPAGNKRFMTRYRVKP